MTFLFDDPTLDDYFSKQLLLEQQQRNSAINNNNIQNETETNTNDANVTEKCI